MQDKTLYVVSGFMRTGTSMMMRALEAGGLDAAYQQSREEMRKRFADEHYDPNIGGLYELRRQDYQKSDFPRGYEGKLLKALSNGVPRMAVMPEGMRVVFMRRDPEEIRQSYGAFFDKQLPAVENQEVFNSRMEDIIERIRNRRDVLSCDVFWYRDVVNDPHSHFQTLWAHGWPIDTHKAANEVDPNYLRFKREELTEGVV